MRVDVLPVLTDRLLLTMDRNGRAYERIQCDLDAGFPSLCIISRRCQHRIASCLKTEQGEKVLNEAIIDRKERKYIFLHIVCSTR
jgi:hypothetical protein